MIDPETLFEAKAESLAATMGSHAATPQVPKIRLEPTCGT